ncbi:MAG: hypothetical protein ACW99U_15210 [Candidatus Thorarchaeota archaeon]
MSRLTRRERRRKHIIIIIVVTLVIALVLGGPLFLSNPWEGPFF